MGHYSIKSSLEGVYKKRMKGDEGERGEANCDFIVAGT